MKRPPLFETEAAMCAAFSEWALGQGWTPYAETAGFDILLVHGDGTQIGVQAKLRFNTAVLAQILSGTGWGWVREPGPDFRAVLTPERADSSIAAALGLVPFAPFRHGDELRGFDPDLEPAKGRWSYSARWHFWNPTERCALPRFVPDVIAGSPAPTQLTKWKIAALAIAATLELRGYVTREDFRYEGIDHRRWTQDWLCAGPVAGQWLPARTMPDFAGQHPGVYPQVREEVRERLAIKDIAA